MKNEQKILLTFVDKDGKTVSAPSGVVPSWVLDNTSTATLTVAADGLSAVVAPIASPDVNVSITASANLADGTALTPGTVVLTLNGGPIGTGAPVAIVLTAQKV